MSDKQTVPNTYNGVPELIRHMVTMSGKSGIQVSRDIGRSDNYLWSMVRNETTPRTDLLVKIAEACGYEVQLVGHDETLKLIADVGNDAPLEVIRMLDDASMRLTGTTDIIEMLDMLHKSSGVGES